jgi:hypothetical protein
LTVVWAGRRQAEHVAAVLERGVAVVGGEDQSAQHALGQERLDRLTMGSRGID